MSIQEVGNKSNIAGYQSMKSSGQTDGFQESLMQNMKYQEQEREDVLRENEKTRKAVEKAGVNVIGSRSDIRVASVALTEAIRNAEIRHMSYEESDNIEIAVVDGCTLKGKKLEEGAQVYVEAKYEDGRLEAYQVDVSRVSEQTEHRIERFALETSGESCGATDSIGIILRQMDDPMPGKPAAKTVVHDGVPVVVTRDLIYGTSITIGGSMNPDWIQVYTSVGTVKIDLNDMEGLSKCLDMFSPEDMERIMRKIMEEKQAREAQKQMDETEPELIDPDKEEWKK